MSILDQTDLRKIKGVGDRRAGLFAKLGVSDVGALLRLYPRGYEDWSHPVTALEALGAAEYLAPAQTMVIKLRLISDVRTRYVRQGMTIYTTRGIDDDGEYVNVTLFNNPYAAKQLLCGRSYCFRGKLTNGSYGAELSGPIFLPESESGGLRPIYRQSEGLSTKVIEQTIKQALEQYGDLIEDSLSQDILHERSLLGLREALSFIHKPENDEQLRRARDRLVYDELLILQLGLLSLKGRDSAAGIRVTGDYTREFFSLLPFEPTNAQKRAVSEAMRDMQSGNRPMARLLQGDVGSGKTAVAAALCFCLSKNGMQSALMAPTEILAEQHYRSLSALLEPAGVRVGLLTGSMSPAKKRLVRRELASGFCSVAVGTHALISEDVDFADLSLVITDEQHRFGVSQRGALSSKGKNPHTLVMSATPIPRTLALMVYGDLDISVLDELPAGRQRIETYAVGSDKRARALAFIRKHLDEGRQAYIICPLVEEGESDLLSARGYAKELSEKEFKKYRVGLLHGRLPSAEKDAVMSAFASGSIQLLVSTTVVEVGVDVPNAVIMLIENAERFGLSQLHQLRGRVGRGRHKSYCILISDARNETAVQRMRTMVSTTDGFKISEEDLRQRGPGDFFGSRQHGLPNLRLADVALDTRMFAAAQQDARALLERDPRLEAQEHAGLRAQVELLFKRAREENITPG